MADRAEPLAALADRIDAAAFDGTTLATVPFLAQIGLRLDPDGPAAARVAAVIGADLPGPNRVAQGGDCRALWLGPDEWVVIGEDGTEGALTARLEEAVGADGSVVDLSANRTGLLLAGPQARDVLATCCSLDFHPRVFGPGQCAQTLVQKAGVLIEQTDADAYLILIRPSFAAYVAEWLLDGMTGLAADLAAVR